MRHRPSSLPPQAHPTNPTCGHWDLPSLLERPHMHLFPLSVLCMEQCRLYLNLQSWDFLSTAEFQGWPLQVLKRWQAASLGASGSGTPRLRTGDRGHFESQPENCATLRGMRRDRSRHGQAWHSTALDVAHFYQVLVPRLGKRWSVASKQSSTVGESKGCCLFLPS